METILIIVFITLVYVSVFYFRINKQKESHQKASHNFRRTLSSLNTGEEGEVIEISESCKGQQRRRLMDLGIIPGCRIKAVLKSVGGDPVAYNIRGALIALRRENAEQIFIKQQ